MSDKKRGRGRPIIDGYNYSITRTYSVKKDIYEKLKEKIDGTDSTISGIIVDAFIDYIKNN